MKNQNPAPAAPVFAPVSRQHRHDGWTPERQRAFIEALADTGSVTRAARSVNMSPRGAYWLRRQPDAGGFRRAWEAALDLGVGRLKDIAFERAIEGQLVPVFVGGKLLGFRRKRNDRLLMFCLRMNLRGDDGRRLSASYFEPAAAEGQPDATVTMPLPSRAEKEDASAALVHGFDPVTLSFAEIETMQTMLVAAAAEKRARGVEQDPDVAFIRESEGLGDHNNRQTYGDPDRPLYAGEITLSDGGDDLEEDFVSYKPGEPDWNMLDDEKGMREIEDAVAEVRRARKD